MINNIKWLGHSTLKIIINDYIIYIDPYNLSENTFDADIIFITHSHYDHFSEMDINKIKKENTQIIITSDLYQRVLEMNFKNSNIFIVKPNKNYQIKNINITTVPSYNINKTFHPKKNNWVGYIIDNSLEKYYIAGDTDVIPENKIVKCDIAFLPIGGTYTMDYNEAAELANIIKPKKVIPIHYGSIVGSYEDALKFKEKINSSIDCIIPPKEEQ